MEKKIDLDPLDYKILEILVANANLPYTEIGQRLDVSGGTVHVRMKKMETLGIVKGAQLLIDYSKIGWDISAFLGIYLDKSSLYEDVAKQLEAIPEVVNIHYTTGIYSIFLKLFVGIPNICVRYFMIKYNGLQEFSVRRLLFL
jgi:Lrp/AsnC family transcriptional regulator for asnA, asnC and gidA